MPVKVRLFASCLIISALTLALLTGCGSDEEELPPDSPEAQKGIEPVESRFGDAYEIVLNETPTAPDEPPGIAEDSLHVKVGYSGGCNDHDFTLRHEVRSDTTRLWLVHDDGGDTCEAYLYDDLRLYVPPEALDAPVIMLLNPQGNAPHMLRWSG